MRHLSLVFLVVFSLCAPQATLAVSNSTVTATAPLVTAKQPATVTGTVPKPDQTTVVTGESDNGLAGMNIPEAPYISEIAERVSIYKFILESLGFSLVELIISPDKSYLIELRFEGKLNTTPEKLQELTDKYKHEEKLMHYLNLLFIYSKQDLSNFGPYKITLLLTTPPTIQIFYRKL